VRVQKSYFSGVDPKEITIFELQAHQGPVSRVHVSYDEMNVFTAGDDGCLMVYQLQLDKDTKVKFDKDSMSITPAEEFLMQRQIYNESIQ
jgi:hypothetical protein